MGVIKKSNISNPICDSIEDVLEDIQHEEQEELPEIRRPRKFKRHSTRPNAIGGIDVTSAKSGKKKKRVDNSNYLLSLAEYDETQELSIHDFIPETVSVFSQMLMHKDNLEILNEFINCTHDDEEWFQKNITGIGSELQDQDTGDISYDFRSEHPAYVASKCFHRIDNNLRLMFKKKHVPLGTLMYFEQELVTFFVNRPTSIYHCQIPNGFERVMVHALSQYLDLDSLSYDRSGNRWTRVKNKRPEFYLPPILLSSFLEKRYTNSCK